MASDRIIEQIRRIAGKFQPPRLQPDQLVTREELFTREDISNVYFQYFILEAQAGQGKTTTALQIIALKKLPYVWYQIGEEDRDPMFFFLSLVETLETNIIGGALNVGIKLRKSEYTTESLDDAISCLITDLNELRLPPFFIVFDDLHLLLNSPQVLKVIDSFLQNVPSSISFLLLTRSQIPLTSKKVKFGGHTLYLTNEDLSFSLHETQLFLLKRGCDPKVLQQNCSLLHKMTEGWIMGIVLGAPTLQESDLKNIHSCFSQKKRSRLNQYFRREILLSLPEQLRREMIKLSFLDEIHVDFLVQIEGGERVVEELYTLVDNNTFLRLQEGEEEVFSLHHLFREVLKEECFEETTRKEVNSLLRQASAYHISRNELEKAVVYTIRIGDIRDIEIFLKKYGIELVCKNRHTTLLRIPDELSLEVREKSPWIQLFEGILIGQMEPEAGLQHLHKAEDLFLLRQDELGQLLTLAQRIFHFFITSQGSAEECKNYLREAEKKFISLESELSAIIKSFICRSLGIGYCVFFSNFSSSRTFLHKAIDNAESSGNFADKNFSFIFLGYTHLLSGNYPATNTIAESLYRAILNNDVGPSSGMLVKHFLTDYLEIIDDYPNYKRSRAIYCNFQQNSLLKKSHLWPSIILWDIKLLIARGHYEEAEVKIEEGLSSGSVFGSPHIRSRFMEYKAYVAALTSNNGTNVLEIIDHARDLRHSSSWRGFFYVRNLLFSGVTFALAQKSQDAEELLSKGINIARDLNLTTLVASGHIFRAHNRLHCDNIDDACDDIRHGLTYMRKNRIDMFWGWSPDLLLPIFTKAHEEGIEPVFIQNLLRNRFALGVSENSQLIPLLKIGYLQDITFSIQHKELRVDLSPKQKDFLGIIISSSNSRVSLEKLQNELWPDVAQEKARSSFDTLLSRLRSSLRPALKPWNLSDYLIVQKGFVSLKNCEVDTHLFYKYYSSGIEHFKNDHYWQAGNNFYNAVLLWPEWGDTLSTGCDTLLEYLYDLRDMYVDIAEKWCPTLLDMNETSLAVQLLNTAWKIAGDNPRIASMLYSHYIGLAEPVKANRILTKYTNILKKEHYSQSEIEEILNTIVG